MTAAFVQPNDITVERLLQKAADLLRGQGKDPALNGYSVGSAHAWEIDPALWEAVAPVEIDVASLDPKDRLARWLRKLLDLSLRNNLLKLKARKKAVRLEASDPGVLLDPLASGQQIKHAYPCSLHG
ncbi:TPA: DUF4011 domain-containing protein [Pseudomonas aeruginosa]|uniref:DUF4011 domain-containing protein n=1 Tax=Pseudomonas aeruginosa TaxID=287 RepID=UPI00093F1CD8|nr:DUF4011 domain-containing protein [Pseudomonas aeruginosa]